MIVTISGYASFSESDGVLTITSETEESPELNPDPGLDLGITGWVDTTNTGVINVNPGQADFIDTDTTDPLSPVGANATAFINALADSAAYTVRVTVTDYVSGNPRCVLKGGDPVDLANVGDDVFEGTIVAGTNTFRTSTKLTGNEAGDFSAGVTGWSVREVLS